MTDENPWKDLPASPFGDDVWYGMTVPDEIAKLTRLHAAIGAWKDLANQQLDEFSHEMAKQRQPIWDEYDYDPVRDEAAAFLETERVMFANLGVTIAATAENFIVGICNDRKIPLTDAEGESDFGIICCNFNAAMGMTLSSLPGYRGNQRARYLGNCFKHNAGKTDKRFAEKYKVPLDQTIEYEIENWEAMINDTKTLLQEIVSRL